MANQELIVLRGIPGSGKSYWAEAWQAESPDNRIIVERDILRRTMFGVIGKTVLSPSQEVAVSREQYKLIHAALRYGNSVCVADTNINQDYLRAFENIAFQYSHVLYKVIIIDTPLDVCLQRNAARPDGEKVPETKIMTMHKRLHKSSKIKFDNRPFVVSVDKTPAFVFDVDGTLQLMFGRSPYDEMKAGSDFPNTPVMIMYLGLQKAYPEATFIVLSGRKNESRRITWEALNSFGLRVDHLFMREDDDNRKDAVIKVEFYEKIILPLYNVVMHVDDRQQVVDAIRALGITVAQVAPGDF